MNNQNTYQPVSMIEPRHSSPFYQPPQEEKRVHKTPFVLAFGAILILGVTAALIYFALENRNTKTAANNDDDEIAEITDVANVTEQLSAHLAALVKGEEHEDYISTSFATRYLDVTPEKISADFGLSLDFPLDLPASRTTEVIAMNSNILNYYLDQGNLVAIYAKGTDPFTEDGSQILVQAARPVDALFQIYSPDESEAQIVTKLDIFGTMINNERFFIIEPIGQEDK